MTLTHRVPLAPKKRKKKTLQDKADAKFQKLVRESGPCRAAGIGFLEATTYDGRTWRRTLPECAGHMEAAHVVTRSRHATRWKSRLLGDAYDGCIPLCKAHHAWQTWQCPDDSEFFRACGVDYALVHAASLHDRPEKANEALERLKGLGAV